MKLNPLQESKYDRAERITWWDQSRLRAARTLVVGAGALGNEIVKNLALVGVGHISIVDMDLIEHTNLSRCVFFREGDEGKAKAEVLAREASKMNPDVKAVGYQMPVQELGDGSLMDFDLIVAGLDNREARVWLGAATKRINQTWIDGAIEGLMGKVQVFTPQGACYACTMSEKDWELIARRKSCTLLGVEEIISGHTPTNATTSSIIAGIQSQEAIKYLVDKPELYALENKVWRMIGEQMSTFISLVDVDETCPYHFDYLPIKADIKLPKTFSELWKLTQEQPDATLSIFDDFIYIGACSKGHQKSKFGFADLMRRQGKCATCEEELNIDLQTSIDSTAPFFNDLIDPHFWPVKALVEFESAGVISRYRINNEGKVNE